nr:hypothetical protein [Tanacetum cinerariifolium]
MTTTTIPPPPTQPQQSTIDPTLMKRIDELEQHMANLLQYNLALEESDWAMQAPLQARLSDLPVVDIKEILQQRMFEDKSYEAHEDYKKLYDALEKSLERDYSDQLLSDMEEARQKKRKRRNVLRTHFGSPPPKPPPPPPPAGTSSTLDSLIPYDSIPDEQKPLHVEEKQVTPEPTWTIPSFNVSDVENKWATTLASTYVTPDENSLLAKTGDMTNILNWYCRQVNKTKLTQADLKGQAYEVVKAFYPDVIHLDFQIEECHKLLTDQVDLMNPEEDQVSLDVNRPLPLGGPPGHVTIQTQFLFNKDLEYLRYGNKGSSLALSISKMKPASYPDFGLKLFVSKQIANLQEHTIAKKDFKNLHPSDFEDLNLLILQGHLDHLPGYKFKHNYTIIESSRAVMRPVNNNKRKIMLFNEIYKFSDGTLTRILEALAYRVKEFKVKRLNPGYKFKHNYTIIESSRAVMRPVNNNKRKIMLFNEIYKFSDGTLTRILEALAYRVKEFKVKRLNPGMNT